MQHALLHLYGPESATFSCPVAMADGAAALLARPETDPAVRRGVAAPADQPPTRPSPITSGQWMTESQGGSDLARSVDHRPPTPATAPGGSPARSGSARPPTPRWPWRWPGRTAPATGSRVLAPFLVPRYAADSPLAADGVDPRGPAPGVTVHRLKDKLGTRALPTAEIGLRRGVRPAVG